MDGWVRVLCPFNSISVISRPWKGEHERLCAMKRRLGSGRISPPAGFEPAIQSRAVIEKRSLNIPRQPIRAKILISTGRSYHYGHLLQVQKESLQCLTSYISFHNVINVYSWRSGADNPSGQNFDVKRNLVTSVICYKFQKNLWFFFSWFYTCI